MKPAGIPGTARQASAISQDAAELLAIKALNFLASDIERLGRFMALSGLSPENLRAAAGSSGFLAAVLNHLAQDETLLFAFASEAGCDPGSIKAARDRLEPPEPGDHA